MTPPEDPWDAWRKRHGADFPSSFFAEFEKEFARMQGMVDKIMQDAIRHAQSPQRGEPFVYGFSMRVGADGVPRLQPFGSTLAQAPAGQGGALGIVPEGREPLTDLQETDKEITLTVELPGVEKKDVNLHVAEETVVVKVEKGRKYAARVKLPSKVVPGSARATFKNGILDVVLQKKDASDVGHHVSIE